MSSGKWRPFCLGLNVLNEPLKQISANFESQHNHFHISKFENIICKMASHLSHRHYVNKRDNIQFDSFPLFQLLSIRPLSL